MRFISVDDKFRNNNSFETESKFERKKTINKKTIEMKIDLSEINKTTSKPSAFKRNLNENRDSTLNKPNLEDQNIEHRKKIALKQFNLA